MQVDKENTKRWVIKMLIKSLEQMESIVEKNKMLSWDGWDVVKSEPNNAGWRFPNGKFIKGKWYVQRRFSLTSRGWELPDKLVR